ncbi:MAG: iduronate sulfatase [Opitutaceae bacterium]|nr:iduronate sulfatase [Opitutaceae bacterium]
MKRVGWIVFCTLVGLLTLGCQKEEARELSFSDVPNVLFIITDDLRPDLGAYGDKVAVTPNIDRLAQDSLLFNRAYCQKAVCWSSRNSFFSGLIPRSLGKKINAQNTFRLEHPDIVALPQLFKNQGWYTRSFGKILHNGQDDPMSWSESFFEPEPLNYAAPGNVDKHPIINRAVSENRVNPLYEAAEVDDEAYEDGLMGQVARRAIREASQCSKPFFFMVGFHKPHIPFNAPKKYWDLYDRENIPLTEFPEPPINVLQKYSFHPYRYVCSFAEIPEEGSFPDDLAREIKHAYYACINYVDALVGQLIEEKENTIIVFTSDHGYQPGDHGLWSKHTNFELATRVPLLVSVTNSLFKVKSTFALVELVDLFPTLAELCGIPQPDHLEGKSFLQVLRNPSAGGRENAYSEYSRNGARGRSIRTEHFRYVEWRLSDQTLAGQELYDHWNDLGENVNVAGLSNYSEILSRLSDVLASR